MSKTRREPVRTCVACRQEAGKAELVRVARVSGPAGVSVDADGRAGGRGAYVHRDPACVAAARRRGALARALRAPVPDVVWAALGGA